MKQKQYLNEKEISPSALFQKVLVQLMEKDSDKWFNDLERAEEEAQAWRSKYFTIKETLDNKVLAEAQGVV